MALRTPLVVVLAGPNGAGKSTSAARLLREALAVEEFVNADTIAQGLSAYRPEAVAVAAGRVMLERLHVLARVAERVRQGGHHVPEDVVRRRFAAGLTNLLTLYSGLVDSWQVYDNADLAGPRILAWRPAGMNTVIADPNAWENLKEKKR